MFRDNDHCKPVIGVLDIESGEITLLDESGNDVVLWLAGEES
jgi:hypothetical protein